MNARADISLGVMLGMSNETYHAVEALGSSGLKKLARSPAHYYASALDPNRPAAESTPAMRAGTLAHCALLEPRTLEERYIVKPEGHDGRTKEGNAWNEFAALSCREIISAEQLATAVRQANAVRALPEIAALLSDGDSEVSAFWIDEATGVLCKCRPDHVSPAGGGVVLLDLKTCPDASPSAFPRSIANFGYHRQAAWYSDGFERASGRRVLGFVFAAVESDYPHAAAAYMLDDESLEKARAENRRLLDLYAGCKASNHWPAYEPSIQALALPAWAF